MANNLIRDHLLPLDEVASGWASACWWLIVGGLTFVYLNADSERFRLKKGQWPNKLEDLVAEGLIKQLTPDPLGPGSLRITKRSDGIIIYSLGPDGEDNQGLLDRQDPRKKGTDLGLQLWNVEARRQPPVHVNQ